MLLPTYVKSIKKTHRHHLEVEFWGTKTMFSCNQTLVTKIYITTHTVSFEVLKLHFYIVFLDSFDVLTSI